MNRPNLRLMKLRNVFFEFLKKPRFPTLNELLEIQEDNLAVWAIVSANREKFTDKQIKDQWDLIETTEQMIQAQKPKEKAA